jgi:hypothetical protein
MIKTRSPGNNNELDITSEMIERTRLSGGMAAQR